MLNAATNTDSIRSFDVENYRTTYRLKKRSVLHIHIKETEELKEVYEFGQIIGKGGFGTVMVVRERSTSKIWAIKSVVKTMARNRWRLVEREIMILKLIEHPHIIYLKKVYESPRKLYMVLEKCRGELTALYKKEKPFPEATAKKVVRELVEAVTYLHKHDIVHRDIKMENILLGDNPDDPKDDYFVKLIDFGLSIVKSGSGMECFLNEFCGTMTYMPPEMIQKCSYSQQCDVWAIGVIVYMLLMGEHPFYSIVEKELQRLICTKALHFDANQCSKEATNLLQLLLEKNPANRITAAEVLCHPWILDTSLCSGSESGLQGNILDMMKAWRSQTMMLFDSEDTSNSNSDKDNKSVRRMVKGKGDQDKDKHLQVVSTKTPLVLPKTDIEFGRLGSNTKQLKQCRSRNGSPSSGESKSPAQSKGAGAKRMGERDRR